MSIRLSTSARRRLAATLVAASSLTAFAAFAPGAAAQDVTAPSTPTGVVAQVLPGDGDDGVDVRVDGEAPGLAGATSSIRVDVATSAARSGNAGVRSASTDAPSFAQWGSGVVPPGTTHASVRTWVRLESRGEEQSVDLLTVANSDGRRNFDFFVTGDMQRFKWDLYSGDSDESSFAVVPGRWYLVEVLVAYAGTRHSATVRIDGVDQGTIVSVGNDVTLASVTIGTHSAKTHSQSYDDLAMRFGSGPVDWIDAVGAGDGGGAGARVLLTWSPSADPESGIRGYHIWRNGSWYAWVPGNETTWTDESPIDRAAYSVRAFDRALNRSGWSAPVTVSLGGRDVTAPPTPRNARVVDNADGTVTVSWDAVVDIGASGLREYAIQRDGRWYGWVPAGTTSFVDEAPRAGAGYRVRAIDQALNRSTWSALVVR
ncbi:MAG: hypothetical protein ACE367_19970 [Acidimicrobiales bacterium]